MPTDPTWNKYDDTVHGYASIYGAEYSSIAPGMFTQPLFNHDVPCAVCRTTARSTVMFLPGRDVCYPGWHTEYSGYIMSGNKGYPAATEYICVDGEPETELRDDRDDNGALLNTVEGMCGSLPCGPYVNGRELTCAVCSL
jgi:hypothetical protein